MKKRLSHFAYNERSRSSWTLTIPHFTPLSPIRSTIKTVTYVPGTFVTLVSGPHTLFHRGIFLCRTLTRLWKKHALSAVEERGKGRFSGEMSTESCGKFQRKKTRLR